MRKKLIALFLSAALVLSQIALAAEIRETDFFTPRDHADLDFDEMDRESADVEAILAQMDAVRTLASRSSRPEEVREGFLEASRQLSRVYTLAALAQITASLDVTDEAAAGKREQAERDLAVVGDALFLLARDILNSPCAAALDGILSEEERESLPDYEALTGEQLALTEKENALVSAYRRAAAEDFTSEYNAEAWNEESVYAAYENGDLDDEGWLAALTAMTKKKNAELGALYLQMVDIRKQIAQAYGYQDYASYAYENLYLRDYTPEEIRPFCEAVKTYIAPVSDALLELYWAEAYRDVFDSDFSGYDALDLMEPYVARLSGELLEAFSYMRAHGLYDTGWSFTKNPQNYTIALPEYGAAFYFGFPYGGVFDFSSVAVHEFGHYNDAYWTEYDWRLSDKSIDVAEVHSQGLELLFMEFYPEIFGQDSQALETYFLYILTNSLVYGALYDELQQYVYATDNVTLDQINREYCRLCREYGIIDQDDPREEMYGWVDVSHNFDAPFYYISYAVSAAGGFGFWLEAREDFYGAVDRYLRFTALDATYGFQESFEAVEMASPLSPDYLTELGEALETELDLEARLADLPVVGYYRDVHESDWFCEAAEFVWVFGLFDDENPAAFNPEAPLTRGQAVTALWRLAGEPEAGVSVFADVPADRDEAQAVAWAAECGVVMGYAGGSFRPDAPVTLQQLAVMLYRLADPDPAQTQSLPYSAAPSVSDYARQALGWLAGEGILGAQEDGALHPQQALTRARAAQLLLDFCTAD